MAVQKVTPTALHFRCPKCRVVNEIPFADIRVFAHGNGHATLVLPRCACGARSDSVPGKTQDTARNHVRRIAWRRAVAAGNFFDEESRGNAAAHTAAFDAFYAQSGREDLRAMYADDASTVEVKEGDQ